MTQKLWKIILWEKNEGEGHRSTKVTLCNKVRLHTSTWITHLKGNGVNVLQPPDCWGFTRKPKTACSCSFHRQSSVKTVLDWRFSLLCGSWPSGRQMSEGCEKSSVTQPADQPSPPFTPPVTLLPSLSKKPGFRSNCIVSLRWERPDRGGCPPAGQPPVLFRPSADRPESRCSAVLSSFLLLTS